MILTQAQLAAIVLFADGEDVFIDPSFPDEKKGAVYLNVGRVSDHSIIRVDPEGITFPISNGSRQHLAQVACWCGENHV